MRIQADGFVAWPKGWVWLSALSLVSTLGAEVQGGPPPAGQAPAQFSPKVIQQFQAIQVEKATWTPVQRKIGSNLLLETKQRLGQAMAAGMPALRQAIAVDRSGLVLVDIKATVTDALLKRIGDLGGQVVNSFANVGAIRARVPLAQVQTLAAEGAVRSIRSADRAGPAHTNPLSP